MSFHCHNCGLCCGPVPIRDWELARIKTAVRELPPETRERLKRQKHDNLTCILRDEEAQKCSVYDKRPAVCRLQGTTEGLQCPMNPGAPLSPRAIGHIMLGEGVLVGVLSMDIGWAELEGCTKRVAAG